MVTHVVIQPGEFSSGQQQTSDQLSLSHDGSKSGQILIKCTRPHVSSPREDLGGQLLTPNGTLGI